VALLKVPAYLDRNIDKTFAFNECILKMHENVKSLITPIKIVKSKWQDWFGLWSLMPLSTKCRIISLTTHHDQSSYQI
jgi:hypothetical protein